MKLLINEVQALLHLQQVARLYGKSHFWDQIYQGLIEKDFAVLTSEGDKHVVNITALGLQAIEEYDLTTGKELKKRGQKRVLANAGDGWRERALSVVFDVATDNRELTMADVRRRGVSDGLDEPHHPNAWGALLKAAAQEGWIEQTESFRQSDLQSARARMVRVWKSLVWSPR